MTHKVTVCGIDTNLLPRLTHEETRQLLFRAKNGEQDARDTLVVGNMRLVLSLVQRFSAKRASYDDLFQVGCVGLIKAIDHFNTEYDVRFSTYAVPMIIGEMKRHLRDSNSLRVSRSVRDTAYKALQAREHLERTTTHEVRMEEIAEELSLPLKEVVCALDAISEPVSLFDPVYHSDDDTVYLMDQIGDERVNQDAWIEQTTLRDAYAKLNEREKNILDLRYYQGKTQTEVSRQIGISQAQVSRLEKNALHTMETQIN